MLIYARFRGIIGADACNFNKPWETVKVGELPQALVAKGLSTARRASDGAFGRGPGVARDS